MSLTRQSKKHLYNVYDTMISLDANEKGIVNGKDVSLKGYNTWLQILRVNGLQCGNCADRSVKDFKSDLIESVN